MEAEQTAQYTSTLNPHAKQSFSRRFTLALGLVCLVIGIIAGYALHFVDNPLEHILAKSSPSKVTTPIVTPGFTINDMDMQIKLDGILDKDLADAPDTIIPNTDLRIKLPTSFRVMKNEKDSYMTLTPIISLDGTDSTLPRFYNDYDLCSALKTSATSDLPQYITTIYCQQLTHSLTSNQKLDIESNAHGHWEYFNIGVVKTDLSPTDWIGDNTFAQGKSLRQWEPDSSKWLETILVHDARFDYHVTMYTREVGCCGGHETVYLYPYTNAKGEKLLIFFVSPDKRLLDRILQTFVASAPDKKNI